MYKLSQDLGRLWVTNMEPVRTRGLFKLYIYIYLYCDLMCDYFIHQCSDDDRMANGKDFFLLLFIGMVRKRRQFPFSLRSWQWRGFEGRLLQGRWEILWQSLGYAVSWGERTRGAGSKQIVLQTFTFSTSLNLTFWYHTELTHLSNGLWSNLYTGRELFTICTSSYG